MLEEKTRTEKAVEPATGWRNLYWYTRPNIHDDGIVRGPGPVWGQHTFPSKDTAETAAAESMAETARRGHDDREFYVGAYPEGETP